MKNKKLFAILTLVCFMFTLMPVAAFAATAPEVDGPVYAHLGSGDDVVEVDEAVSLKVTTGGTYFVYAVKDGAFAKLSTTNSSAEILANKVFLADFEANTAKDVVSFDKPGEYTIVLAPWVSTTQQNIVANVELTKTDAQIMEFLGSYAADVTMYNNVVKVGDVDSDYEVVIQTVGTTTEAGQQSVQADNGYSNATLQVQVTNHGYGVPNVEVNLYTDSHGITVTKLDAKTNAAGIAKFMVTGTIPSGAGAYHVYATYADASDDVAVAVTSLGVAKVETAAEPTAPVKVGTALKDAGIEFKFTDATGMVTTPGAINKVTVLSAPAGYNKLNTITWTDYPTANDGKWTLNGDALNYEGDYTFQVALQNGSKATASVKVMKQGDVVGIKFVKAPTTLASVATTQSVLGAYGAVYTVDANGVVATPEGSLTYSVNGKAVESFDATNKWVTVDTDEKYIGSTVTVLAVYKVNGKTFTATNDMTIVSNAESLVYVVKDAEVGANSTLVARIVDENGKVVTLDSATVQAIVLEKPENAVATFASTSYDSAKGVLVTILASQAGEYKIQTIVTYADDKYVSSIDTITVGGGANTFKDVIVMSIGANTMVKNSATVAMPAAPEIVDSRTMVPARAGLEAFGATVAWDEAAQTVTAELGGVKVVMTIGEKAYTVNGKVVVGDAAPYITAASTMVPVSFFTNAFGITATPIYDANGVCDVLFTK